MRLEGLELIGSPVFATYVSLASLSFFLSSTFSFQGLRLDEALRLYLEAFRLPGEAPVIQRLLEAFTEHWRVSCMSGPGMGFYGSN